MNSPWQIKINRLTLLMRNDVVSQIQPIMLTAGAAFTLLFVAWIVSLFTGKSGNFYPFFFGMTMVLGGAVLISLSFTEMHHPLRGIGYLTLPGSIPEKYISKFLLTSVGFAGATVVFFYIFSLIAALLTRIFFGITMPVFNLGHEGTFRTLVIFLQTHPVIFFGSIYFRRFALLKTVLSVFTFIIALGFVMFFVGWKLFTGVNGVIALHNFTSNVDAFFKVHGTTLLTGAKIITRFVIPVFFIGLGFLRLTEYEVNNGV